MSYALYTPRDPLSLFVENLWAVDEQVSYTREKILPTATLELIINFGAPFKIIEKVDESKFQLNTHSWICGFQTEYILNEPVAETNVMGVRFKPGGAYPFFGCPIQELNDQIIPMDLIWGAWIDEVRERLWDTPRPQARFLLLEQLMLERLDQDANGWQAIRYSVERIERMNGHLNIRDLSDEIGMSQKHLNTQFKKMIGVSPKTLARILKFQNVLQAIDPTQPINWTEIAHRCHYYDQAHFNKDFAAFTGLNPSAYVKLRNQFLGDDLQQGEGVHFVPTIG